MTDDAIVSVLLVLPLLALVVGFLLSWLGWEKFFPLHRVTKRTAINLLRSRAFDEWNEFRTLNRDWTPKIVKLVLQNSQALDTDFSNVTISQSTFRGTDLSGASFLAALLIDVDFSEAILRGAPL
ncbi:MAG: pentapeptide repeat-containing protein [Phycisphaerales bacterium]